MAAGLEEERARWKKDGGFEDDGGVVSDLMF